MKENTPKNIGVPVKSLLFSLKSAVFFKSFNQTVTFGQIIDRADSGFLSLTGRTIDLPGLTGAVAAGENAFDACFACRRQEQNGRASQTRQKLLSGSEARNIKTAWTLKNSPVVCSPVTLSVPVISVG